jgi:tetratricopeptide (TPR) repeat protein
MEYASSLANLANIHLVERDYGTAERLARQALSIMESNQDESAAEVALAARNSLAEVLRLQDRNEESLDLMEKNLAITMESFDRMHPHTARALNFLGKAQLQAGKQDAALRSLLDAFEIQKAGLGAFHHNTVSIASNVIYILDKNPSLSTAQLDDEMSVYRKMLNEWVKEANSDKRDSKHPREHG